MSHVITANTFHAAPVKVGIFKRITAFIAATNALRNTAEALSRLSDRELRDIGLTRTSISEIANEAFDKTYRAKIA